MPNKATKRNKAKQKKQATLSKATTIKAENGHAADGAAHPGSAAATPVSAASGPASEKSSPSPTDLFEICAIPGKGQGMVALVDLPPARASRRRRRS